MTRDDTADRLETAHDVLVTMARVAYEKADYVASGGSHGDPSPVLARAWRRVARAIDAAATTANQEGL